MIRFVLGLILFVVALIAIVTKKVMRARGSRSSDVSTVGIAATVCFVLAPLLCLWSIVRVVPANNVGIPTSFGSIGSPMASGFHFTAPWTSINNFSTRTQELSMLAASDEGDKKKDDSTAVIAKGGGSMNVDATVRYSVDGQKASTLFRQAGTMDLIKDRFVRPDAREVIRNVFGQYSAEEGYSSKRGEIAVQITKDLKERLAARGIIVDSVNVRDVAPNPEVMKAINSILESKNAALKAVEDQKHDVTVAETKKQVAERDRDATITKAQGDAQATTINADAQAAANTKIAASLSPELAALERTRACADAIARTQANVVSCGESVGSNSASAGSSIIVDGRQPAAK